MYVFIALFVTCNCLEIKIGVLDSFGGIKGRGPAVTESIKNFTADGVFDRYNVSIR